jgi:Mu transposase, C-terminal domain
MKMEMSSSRIVQLITEQFLRGSRDFSSLEEYRLFLMEIVRKRNEGRKKRVKEELSMLKDLPEKRQPDWSDLKAKVSRGSIIRVRENSYSVPSRLIGETVDVRLQGGIIAVFYAGRCVEKFPRLSGKHRAKVNYRHIIDWLLRKPGAFEHYRYREELYPSTIYRTVYDLLKKGGSKHYVKEYLLILKSACQNGEKRVEEALRHLLKEGKVSVDKLNELLFLPEKIVALRDVVVGKVDLLTYDALLSPEVCDG